MVTTFATTAIGSGVPILIAPAMHISMYDHKILQENIKKCKEVGVKFVEPQVEKNKAKMADIYEIVSNVIRETGRKDLSNKKILVIGGPSREVIDDVRAITNRSSGKTAISLAMNAFYRGADVELWYGLGGESPPMYIKTVFFESINDVIKLLKSKNIKKFDIIILCAALSDYILKKQKGKIPSGKPKLIIEMTPAPKIITGLRKKAPNSKIVGFKLEENEFILKEKAMNLLKKNNLDFVIANTVSGFEKDENEILIIDKNGKSIHKKDKKEQLANHILDIVK